MSEAKEAEINEEGETGSQEAPPPAGKSRKKIFLIVAAVIFLAGAGAGGWLFFLRPPADKIGHEEVAEEAPDTFVDVPPIQVALRGADGSSRMLKLHVMLVPGSMDSETLTNRLPQLIDRFQPFLRELRPEDMSGSAATFRVKEELLIRSNQALGAGSVRDVLIQDLMQA